MATRWLVFLAIVTAATAALALVLLTGGGARVDVGAPLLQRSVFGAMTVEVHPSGSEAPFRVERTDERWTIARDGWPADDSAVRGMLRLLSEVAVEGAGAAPGADETRLTLEFEDGERAEFWIEPSAHAVGGGATIRDAQGRFGSAPVDLARALETPSVDAWRTPGAMPRVEIEASRLTIERSEGEPLSLARVRGSWFLRAPAHAKADDRAVAALLGGVIDLRATRFGGTTAGASTAGIRALVIEQDRRTAGPDDTMTTGVERSALRVLGAANADGSETLVDSDGVTLSVRTDRLAALALSPEAVVARSATTTSPSDVGMLVLRGPGGEVAFRRKVLEWEALGEPAERLLNPSDESGGVERVLGFLAHAQAIGVRFMSESEAAPTRFLQIFGLDDAPRATLGLRWSASDTPGEAARLAVIDETVERVYDGAQVPPLLRAWLDSAE